MTLLDNALEALGRGLSVHPLLPRTKLPATPHGSKDRTRDESQVRRWWAHNPNFNIGVNAGVVLDIDRGCKSLESCFTFAKINGVPAETLVIRSGGRRADGSYSAQFHFSGTAPRSGPYESNGVTGEIRSLSSNLYGLYAGSIHPDTGLAYEIVVDLPIAPWPEGLSFGRRAYSPPSDRLTAIDAETARETFEHLLYDVTHATTGRRNYTAHRVTWFAARASLAGVLDQKEASRRIMDAVKRLYRPGERDISKMLRDSWCYGLKSGRLPLNIYRSDYDRLFAVVGEDDASVDRALRLLDGVIDLRSSARATRDQLITWLERAGFDEEGKTRILAYSGLNDAVDAQLLAELKVNEILTRGNDEN